MHLNLRPIKNQSSEKEKASEASPSKESGPNEQGGESCSHLIGGSHPHDSPPFAARRTRLEITPMPRASLMPRFTEEMRE